MSLLPEGPMSFTKHSIVLYPFLVRTIAFRCLVSLYRSLPFRLNSLPISQWVGTQNKAVVFLKELGRGLSRLNRPRQRLTRLHEENR
jgi:hypothetical protein